MNKFFFIFTKFLELHYRNRCNYLIFQLSSIFISINIFQIKSMGASVCKTAENDQQTGFRTFDCRKIGGRKENELIVELGSQNQNNKDQIKPIEFSQLSSHMEEKNFQSTVQDSNFKLKAPESCVMVSILKDKTSKVTGHEGYEAISVPFSVIQMAIPEQIKKQIKQKYRNFFENHSNLTSESAQSWKLQKQGFYSNICGGNEKIFLVSEDLFYWGKRKQTTLIPEKEGILFTNSGYYEGEFLNGKAHNIGKYVWNADEVREFVGQWLNGEPISGELRFPNFTYKGSLKNGVPEGQGVLKMRSNKGQKVYEGKFKQGKFSDTHAFYSTKRYIYKGGFLNGLKDGKGQYTQRRSNSKSHKNGAVQKLKGLWKNDQFIEQIK